MSLSSLMSDFSNHGKRFLPFCCCFYLVPPSSLTLLENPIEKIEKRRNKERFFMCVAGGKRCEYSDAISNVRRKVRNRMKGKPSYEIQDEVNKEVKKFREENSELVSKHLPARANFQYDPPEWKVPASLLDMLGSKRAPITGAPKDKDDAFAQDLYTRNRDWNANLTEQEQSAILNYTQSGYESTNPFLRQKGYREWAKQKPHLIYRKEGDNADTYAEEVIKPRIADMDSAFAKVPQTNEPQKLYRFFEIPSGITPEEYISKYFPAGGGHKDKGFMSTSADPEFVAAEVMTRAEKKKNTRYVIMEILSNSGGSLQSKPYRSAGKVQTLEAEVLLPRNSGLRIIDSGKRSFTFASDREDLEMHARRSKKELDFSEGKKFSLPVIRMIDENLIREVRKTEKAST